MAQHQTPRRATRQRGVILIALLAILGVGAIYLFLKQLNASQLRTSREQITTAALAQAKEALVGYAIAYGDTHPGPPRPVHGYLPCPDPNGSLGVNPEGSSETCGGTDVNAVGRLPWKTIGLPVARDGNGECLWYAVSGAYKNNPPTSGQMNWDNNGTFQILAADGVTPLTSADNPAIAVIFSPGSATATQDRSSANAPVCGGNYTATNYLDNDTTHGINNADIATGQFIQPHEHRDADGNVILTVNDRMTFITKDDIFPIVMRRSDFAAQVATFLDDASAQATLGGFSVFGTKGTGNINCATMTQPDFCNNWKEMLFLTQLSVTSSITIDGSVQLGCNSVLIFAGQKISPGQVRILAADKSNKANYLEGTNLAAFNAPIAHATNFSGSSAFSASNPSADLVRCLP